MDATAFVDTNTLPHYQPVDQIDWCGLLGADRVVVVVAQVIFRELNWVKDAPGVPRRKQNRAARVLRQLDEFTETQPDAVLRPGVLLSTDDRDPSIDFGQYLLNKDLGDDWLLASIIDYRLRAPQSDPRLVTCDTGLKLKARRLKIKVHPLPDDLRLPQEPDPEEARIRELEKENRELRDRLPRLKLCFSNGSNHGAWEIPEPVAESPAPVLNDLRSKYPKLHAQSVSAHPLAHPIDWTGLTRIPDAEITRCNEDLDRFYEAYEAHVAELNKYKSHIRLELLLRISNDGTCPAENVRIALHFPEGFELYDGESVPKPPAPPEPPVKPLTLGDRIARPLLPLPRHLLQPTVDLTSLIGHTSRNVSRPKIARSDSYTVRFDVKSLQHDDTEELDPLCAVFDTFEDARSFHIEYSLIAANLPRKQEGELHVEIRKVT